MYAHCSCGRVHARSNKTKRHWAVAGALGCRIDRAVALALDLLMLTRNSCAAKHSVGSMIQAPMQAHVLLEHTCAAPTAPASHSPLQLRRYNTFPTSGTAVLVMFSIASLDAISAGSRIFPSSTPLWLEPDNPAMCVARVPLQPFFLRMQINNSASNGRA